MHNKTALDRRVYLADPQAPSSGRRKIEAVLEALLGNPEMHLVSSCAGRATMFRLQKRRAASFTRTRDVEGEEVPDVRSEYRPPIPFYPSGDRPRYRRENVF